MFGFKKKHLIVGILFPILTSCQSTNPSGNITLDQRKNLEQHMPVDISQPLDQRAVIIPSSLLQTWKAADSSLNPVASSYKAYLPSKAEQEQLKQSFTALPKNWQSLLKYKLTRIFFVENLIGAGITDWVINRKTNEQFYTIMLNPKLFNTSAQNWLEYRANSMFSDGDYRITYANFPPVSALTYALLHETAHIIDFEQHITPVVDPLIAQYMPITNTPTAFSKQVWSDYAKPEQSFDFPYRNKLNAYQLNVKRGFINNQNLPQIFASLEKLPFVSLYASLSWAEDYAELITFYHLQTMTKTPLRLQLKKGKETIVDSTPLNTPINQKRLLTLSP